MKLWMSPLPKKKPFFPLSLTGKIIFIVLLSMLLILGGVFLLPLLPWPRQITSVVLCLAVTALDVILALRLGRTIQKDALIFILGEDNLLYVVQPAQLVYQRYGTLPFSRWVQAVQRQRELICQQVQEGKLPLHWQQILQVEGITERAKDYSLVCQVVYPDQTISPQTFLLPKEMEELRELLVLLEQMRSSEQGPEINQPSPLPLFFSLLGLVACVALCILSHPAVGRLPQKIYFPCLGLCLLALFCFLYALIKRRRGE